MSALIILVAAALWLGLGYLIWRVTLARRISTGFARSTLAVALAGLWLFAPWADEWLGAREFKRLCEEMPAVKFYGPVAVGSGLFFDEQGRRRVWTQSEIEAGKSPFPKGDTKLAYEEGRRFEEAWTREFERTQRRQSIRSWPIPVLREVTTYVQISTGKVVREDYWLGSPGGWIKRISGWGSHAPYSCLKQAAPYPHELWITYQHR
ncbi:MAG: hypothetical protein HS128_12460 [Ideonella sp.]|nr:hypothetical protein [Ideonella sp.]